MRAVLVVVRGVLVQDRAQVPPPGDQHPVSHLRWDGADPAPGISVRRWAACRDRHHLDPAAGQHRVEGVGDLPGPVPDQEAEPGGALPKIGQQVPRLRHRPRSVGVRGHAKNVDVAGTGLDDEEHIDPAHGNRAVHGEEAARQHGGCLGAQQVPPGGVAALTQMPRPGSSPWIRR